MKPSAERLAGRISIRLTIAQFTYTCLMPRKNSGSKTLRTPAGPSAPMAGAARLVNHGSQTHGTPRNQFFHRRKCYGLYVGRMYTLYS